MAYKDYYEYTHGVSNKRLAEMLREHNKWRRGVEPPYDKVGAEPPFDCHELGAIIDEAARRIENMQSILESRIPFNDEQFNI